MKVKFVSRINTSLFVIPVLFILAIYFGIGVWLYFSGAADLLRDFHSAQLVTTLADKKNGVELWFDIRRKSLEDIAGNPVVASGIQSLSEKKTAKTEPAESMQAEKAPSNQLQQVSKYLAGFGQFRAISFLSAEGRVIWSTNREIMGGEKPYGELFRNAPKGKTAVVAGKINQKGDTSEIFITAPVLLKGKDSRVRVIGQLNPADLAASLVVEKGFYQTGRVTVIDQEGIVLASRDMTDVGKIKFNVPQGSTQAVEYRDGFFFVIAPLKFEGLRLIATLDSSEAAKPLAPFLDLYMIFAGIILLIVIVQCLLLAPRLINRPVEKLLKAMQLVSEGDMRAINLKRGFSGELKSLTEGFSEMIIGLSRRKPARDKVSLTGTADRSRVLIAEVLAVEVKVRLDGIRKRLEGFLTAHPRAGKDVPDIAISVKCLIETIDALNSLIRLKDGSVKLVIRKCELREILAAAEADCREQIGGKEIELIVDIHSNLDEAVIMTDLKVLKRLIDALLRHAIRVTEVGTITMFASHEAKGGIKYLELALSDTGPGVERQAIEWVLKEGNFPSQHIDLGIAREFTEVLGGKIAIESQKGRGSLVTVHIPVRGGVPKGENKKKQQTSEYRSP
jgi:signal transduction histidine kinase